MVFKFVFHPESDVALEHALEQPDRGRALTETRTDQIRKPKKASDSIPFLDFWFPDSFLGLAPPDLPNLANFDYVERVNRAVDYITGNLKQPLRLEDVALDVSMRINSEARKVNRQNRDV